MSKLDEIYGVKFTGKVFNIENRLEWIKSSIDFAMEDDEFREDLVNYMKTFVDYICYINFTLIFIFKFIKLKIDMIIFILDLKSY